jgi:nicotinamidase-related amidase
LLHPSHPGNRLKSYVRDLTPSLLVTKSVNSSFHGSPDLHHWLRERDVRQVAIAGMTTNHCCEATARVGGNLRYGWLRLRSRARRRSCA